MKKTLCTVVESPKRITEGKFSEKESYLVPVQYDDGIKEDLVVVPELFDAAKGKRFSMRRIKCDASFVVAVKHIKLGDGSRHALAWEIDLAL